MIVLLDVLPIKKIINPETKEVIVDKLEMITENKAEKIVAAGIKEVEIRTILTCGVQNGVCQKNVMDVTLLQVI